MQFILLLLLMANYMSIKIDNFILSCRYFSLSIGLIKIMKIDVVLNLHKSVDFEQPNTYLKELGMESGGSFIIHSDRLFVLFLWIILHFLIWLLYSYATKQRDCKQRLVVKRFKYFTYNVYIRILLGTHTFILVFSMLEMKNSIYYQYHGSQIKTKWKSMKKLYTWVLQWYQAI